MDLGATLKPRHVLRRFPLMRFLIAAPVIAGLGLTAFYSLKVGYADRLYHQGTTATVARARRLLAENAAFFQDDPRDRSALEHAVAMNPRYSPGWIELGLRAEIGRQIPLAEQFLLEAARVDNTYEPRWTLANFYFRIGEQDKFWIWARKATEMAYYDQTPLFRLCWRATQDPAVILTRAIPPRPSILAQYLNFLLLQGKITEAEAVGEHLIPRSTVESAPLLVSYCDRLIGSGRMASAVRVWNALCERGLLPYLRLEPSQGRLLTNGEFTIPPRSAGFDWRSQPPEGITAARVGSPSAFRFSFSGGQPERCQLLSQVLPVESSRGYQLVYNSRMAGIPAPSGLRWYVSDLATWKEISAAPLQSSEDSWRQGTLSFVAPPGDRGVLVVLEYQRAQGTTRIEGELWLRQVSLAFQ
jgi:hypothetical protein